MHEAFAQLDQIPLPAESEWVPAPRSGRSAARVITALALAALAVVAVAVALRGIGVPLERDLVPAAPSPAAPAAVATPIHINGLPAGITGVDPNNTHRVTGSVFETVGALRRPLVNVRVVIGIDTGGATQPFAWETEVQPDLNGRFEITALGRARYIFWAQADGYVQPTVVALLVNSDATVDVELIAASDVAAAPLQPATTGVTLSGIVFETVDGVRRPVPGVRVVAEWMDTFGMADTITDQNGRYRLYGIPKRPVAVLAAIPYYGDGIASINLATTDPSVDDEHPTLDIQLKRLK